MAKIKFEPVRLKAKTLVLIDQRALPTHFRLMKCRSAEEVWHAIQVLAVRGAPAIGIAGAYGMYLGIARSKARSRGEWLKALEQVGRYLATARPTAVNLAWAIDRIIRNAKQSKEQNPEALTYLIRREAEQIHREDQTLCEKIGRSGSRLIQSGDVVLTHCNAGGLATSGFGTALAVLFTAKGEGKKLNVFATETRPLLQGARLTMWELKHYGIPATLVCDSAVGTLMRQKKIRKVIVGADRIARNGDTANKIGTYSLASLAKSHNIPFYVAAPTSTFDLSIPNGRHIPIEERSGNEIASSFGKQIAPLGVRVYNPAFDVTPHRWISGFITDKGVIRPPYVKNFRVLKA